MAHVFADRVAETSSTTGTGTLTLAGALPGFRTFAAIGDGNTCDYLITDKTGAWEMGKGTYTASGTTLARTSVELSTNSNAAVNFTPGPVQVAVVMPSKRIGPAFWVRLDGSGTILASHNVTSITKNATGDFTVTMDRDFSSANYVVQTTIYSIGGGGTAIISGVGFNNPSMAAGTVRIFCVASTFSYGDPEGLMVAGFGELAI